MGKAGLSVTVDDDIPGLLAKTGMPKSEAVNYLLRRALTTEQGIKANIEYHKAQIIKWEQLLNSVVERSEQKIENVSEKVIEKLKIAKEAISKDPSRVHPWMNLMKAEYGLDLTEDELLRMIERWAK